MNEILIIFIVFFVLAGILCFVIFYNGGKKKIHVSRKYIKNAPDDKKAADGKNYIIECKFGNNKEKIHTLKCTKEIYDKLRMGENYIVIVKSSKVAKVIK